MGEHIRPPASTYSAGITPCNLVVALLALSFHITGALWVATNVAFPSMDDELQHFSYIREMAEVPVLFPQFERLRIVDSSLKSLTTKSNYLNHPSPYYHLMAWLDDSGLTPATRVQRLRIANLFISSLGIMIVLCSAMSILPSPSAFFTFAAVFVMFPKLAVVGGFINNDNLGIFAAGISFAGLARVYQGGGYRSGILLGLGIALAGWTKLTVLIMVGFALAGAELIRFFTAQTSRRGPVLAVGVAIGALGLIPTLQNFAAYGWPLFISADHNFLPIAERPELDFHHYTVFFLEKMTVKWSALEPAFWFQTIGQAGIVVAVLATMAIAVRAGWESDAAATKHYHSSSAHRIAAAYGLSTLAALAVHIAFGWQMFQQIGDLTSAQTRYYYGVWPGVALAVTMATLSLPGKRLRFVVSTTLLEVLALSTIQAAALYGWVIGKPLVVM